MEVCQMVLKDSFYPLEISSCGGIFFVALLVAAFNLVCYLNIVLEGITNKPTIVTLLW
jgi:hypothetical protein